MSAIDRGRGRGGVRGGPGGSQPTRGRGVWRGGPPPGSTSHPVSRGASPAIPGSGAGPRTSINDHMNDMKKVVQDGKGKGFQTDTDISKSSGLVERELKPWVPDTAAPNGPQSNGAGSRDADTFGAGATNIPWDQFETNERLFGTKTSFQEELYTTKLNKNGADFKKREKDAERLAAEIMGTTAKNSHVLEERGQAGEDATKDEEDKYSGVVRAPGAYVPPGARKATGLGESAPRVSAPTVPAKPNGSNDPSPPQPPKAVSPAPIPTTTITPPPPGPPRSTSEDPAATVAAAAGPDQAAADAASAPSGADAKADGQLGGVMNQWRQFVGTEKEKIEAKKQSVMKSERDRQLADLKKFHANFKVPLPMPKDILSILSKDELKQKDIEAKAASALESAREAKKAQGTPSPVKASAPMEAAKTEVPKAAAPKKPFMKIPEIPPFNASKRKSVVAAPTIPVPETAKQDVPQIASPTPSNNSLASASQAKLNPKASSFVFKPNPGAAVFKPGQPSTGSPAQASRPLPPSGSSVASPAPAPAAPAAPKNPFFKDKLPERIAVDPRHDFSPWKHGSGQVPNSTTIGLQWPYSGRKSHVPSFAAPMAPMHVPAGFGEDDASSPSPHAAQPPLMPGLPPNYPPYGYRFSQPGLLPQAIPGQMGSPMFSPGPQFAPLPGQPMGQQPPQHLGPGGPQASGMPIYFQGGIPQNPQFIPPQHLHFNPHPQQRHGPTHAGHGPGPGPGPGPGGPGGPQMFYSNHVGTPHHTPQLQHNLPFPPQPPQFNHQHSHSHSPMSVAQSPLHPAQAQAPGPGPGPGGSTGNITPSGPAGTAS